MNAEHALKIKMDIQVKNLQNENNAKNELQHEPRVDNKAHFIPKYSSLLLAIDQLFMKTVADINKKYQNASIRSLSIKSLSRLSNSSFLT
jgi:hypothetical protein